MESLPLWQQSKNEVTSTITPYLYGEGESLPAMLVCPGGGYGALAYHEGEPVASWIRGLGLHAFVLRSRIAPHKHPAPLADAQRAMRTIRANAKEWRVDPKRVGVIGFSAGGHLAASLCVHFDMETEKEGDAVDALSARPNAAILCYPVITFGEQRHHGSMVNLLGERPDETLRATMSLETCVRDETPPTFIWHTANDAAVPVANTLLYANALAANRISFEAHIYPDGPHGIGLAKQKNKYNERARAWTACAESWLADIGFLDKGE